MEKFEHLKMIYDQRIDDVKLIKERINSGEPPNRQMTGLAVVNQIFAIDKIYIHNDICAAKLFFYRSARAAEFDIQYYNHRLIESGINHICSALLSDNPYLIERYSAIPAKYELSIGFQMVNAIQNVINGRVEKLQVNIKQITRYASTKTYKSWEPIVPVFEAFLNQDQVSLEQALLAFLVTHKKRNTDPLISRFLSLDTAGLCKLAWIKGYEIDLKSDLVPLELMPIKPLERYEDDDVLKMLLNVN